MNTSNENKLKELLLYVAERCSMHQLFGKVKLNKILFFSDTNAYLRHGKPITGASYEKREFGPVPTGMADLLAAIVSERSAVIIERDMPDLTVQKRVVPLRKADLTGFSAEDVAIVNDVIEWIRPMSAHQISELSHQSAGWEVARMGEEIPYATALIPEAPLPLSASEMAHGKQLAEQMASL